MTQVQQHLTHLESSGLIALAKLLPDLEYLFRHALVQDAAYASLLRQDRKRLHLAVAEALEAAYPHRLDEFAALLAGHFAEAADVDRALAYYRRAGDHAYDQYALTEAIAHYSAAIDLIMERGLANDVELAIHVTTRKGRAFELRGEEEEALLTYQTMEAAGVHLELPEVVLAGLVAQCIIFSVASRLFDPDKALALAERAHALAYDLGDRAAESRILWTQGLAYGVGLRDIARSNEFMERALLLARELGMDEHRAFILTDMAFGYVISGRVLDAASALEEAIPIWRSYNNLPMLAFALNQVSQMKISNGRLIEARENAQEANTIATAIENHEAMGYSSGMLSNIERLTGNIGGALDRMLAAESASSDTPMISLSRYALARLTAELGACDRLHELRADRLSLEAHLKLPFMISLLGVTELARAELMCGGPGSVMQRIEQISKEADSASEQDVLVWTGVLLGRQATHVGDYEEALRLYDVTLAAFERRDMKVNRPEALLYKAEALVHLGRDIEALDVLRGAADEARDMGCRLILWRILSALATLTARMEMPEEAARYRSEGRAVLDFMAASLDRYPDLRASLLAMPAAAALREGSHAAS